jgi:hypothetical protein
VVTDSRISYIAFVPGWDLCYCEFSLEAQNSWTQSWRMLQDEKRRPDERITDARIYSVAKAGNMITAIRLYRAKYKAGLVEGKAGVEKLLAEGRS